MARTAEKVRDLASEDASMENAIGTVLAAADANGGHVEWADVNDEITSGQWGRLIEKDVLVSADDGNGFRFADERAVREAIGEDVDTSVSPKEQAESEEDDSSWSVYDKAAAVGSVAMFAGYNFPQVRNPIGQTLDIVLGPLDAVLPFYVVVLILAAATGLYSTLLRMNLMNTSKMGEVQEKMQDIQDRLEEAKERDDEEAVDRLEQERMEAMGDQMGMMKEQFRPMVWIMLLTIPVFLWLYWITLTGRIPAAESTVVMPLVGSINWTASVFFFPAWIAWYFVCSLGFSQIIRKALDANMSPTAA
jgi:uncharacterized membrane protein (DUF106 family)